MKKNGLIMKKYFTIFLLVFIIFSISNSQTAVKRVLLEEFSTAPCGFCPEGGIIADQLLKKYPELISFTHHAGFGTDSMTISESNILAAKFTNFAPAGIIDRNYHSIPVYTYPDYLAISRQKWDSIVAIHLNDPADADIEITNLEYKSETKEIKLDFSISFLKDFPEDDYRYNVALIEDSVSGVGKGWDQKNYFNSDTKYPELYQKGDPIVGYIHRHVVRLMPYGAWGSNENMPKTITANTKLPVTLTLSNIPNNWKIKDCKIIVFLSKYSSNIQNHKIYNSVEMQVPYNGNKVKEIEQESSDYGIYPNPVADLAYINLSFTEPTSVKLQLFDALGEKIRDLAYGTYLSQNIYFYCSDLPNGTYFIKIETTKMTKFVNFIVEK